MNPKKQAKLMPTKTAVIKELRRLIKPRTYLIHLWNIYGIQVKAAWKSDVSLDIETETVIITSKRKKNLLTIEGMKAELAQFKADIDHLCSTTDALAEKEGQVSKYNKQAYFEELLEIAEKELCVDKRKL